MNELTEIPDGNLPLSNVQSNENFTKWMESCGKITIALEILTSLDSRNELIRIDQPLLVQILIHENFEELNQDQLIILAQTFYCKAAVIFFMSKDFNSMDIYWKSKDFTYFLFLAPPKKLTNLECKDAYEFVSDFLIHSLARNHSGIQKGLKNSTDSNKIELNYLSDSSNLNLLQLTADSGKSKYVKILLDSGIFEDMPYQTNNSPTLALNGKHYEVLLMLMKGNFKYPNRRHFYNKSNQSALKVALDKKLYNMYEILLSNDITFGPHEDFTRVFAGLSENDKTILREIHFRCSKDLPENHMNVLMMNTSISHDDMQKEGKEELVLRAYRFLNKNPNLNPILKVVAASKRFNIIFDFKRNSVAAVDPTAPPEMRGFFYMSGKICVGAKQLLDPSTEHETFGTLAHELCHHALNLTFSNMAKPYAKNDQKSRNEYREIFQYCQKMSGKEEIIDFAFKESPSVHKAELMVRPAHLLALYDNQPEKLADLQVTYAGLFKFHTDKVIPAMIAAIPGIRKKADVEIKEKDKKIFKMTRNFYIAIGLGIIIAALVGMFFYKPTYVFDELTTENQEKVRNAFVSYKNVSVQFKDLFRNDSTAYEKLTSEHIKDMLEGVVLDFDDPLLHYLDEIISLQWDDLHDKLKAKFLKLDLNFQGQTVKFDIFSHSASGPFKALTPLQINKILDSDEFKIGQNPNIESEFFIDRKFMPEDAKPLLFEYQLGNDYSRPDGQERPSYEEIFIQKRTEGKSFQRFCDEFLNLNLSSQEKIIEKVKQNKLFWIQNYDLNQKSFLFMHESSQEIIQKADRDKFFVLSSEAGAGKTIAFEHFAIEIKELHPSKWVSYVDLKSNVEFFNYNSKGVKSKLAKSSSKYFTTKNVLKVLQNILKLNQQQNDFEVRIFEELYISGNLVLVWNGYDEISPAYSEFVLDLINFIHNSTSNVQYICTRPLYSDQLSEKFSTRPYQLVPLNAIEKREFLKKYFTSQDIEGSIVDKNIEKVEKIIKKFLTEGKLHQDFNTPLMLKLVAEIHIDKILMDSENTYGIYETFIKKKIGIWLKKGGSAHKTTEDLIFDSNKFNIMDFYQKYAFLNEISLYTSSTLATKLQKLQIMQIEIPKSMKFDKISEMGVLYINGKNKFEFAHKTFAEFFIARYFIENIYNAPKDVQEDEAELRLELFFKLVKSHGEKQTIITDFMKSYLDMNKDKKSGKFAPAISKLLRTKFKKFLFRILDTNYPKIYEFLFEFFNKEHELLIDLLQVHQSETFYTAIFNPSYFALATNAEDIKSLSKSYLNSSEYEKFITGVNQKGIFYYGLYFYEQVDAAKSHAKHDDFIKQFMYDDYWTFFQKIQDNLTSAEQKEMFLAAINPKIYLYYNRIGVFFNGFGNFVYGYGDMWYRYEHLLSKNETKDALADALIQYNEIYPGDKKGNDIMISTLISYIEEMQLNDFEVFEMFKSKNILHESHYFLFAFDALWTYLSNHTTKEQRRQILHQDDKDDKNLYLYYQHEDNKDEYARNTYYYYIYDFTPFKIFHRAFTVPSAPTMNKTIEIYEEHFSKTEIQDLIMISYDFLYYAMDTVDWDEFQRFVDYLKDLFKGNEKKLVDYLERKIKPTNLSIFEYIENLRGLNSLPYNLFKNLDMLKDLYSKVKA